MYKPLADSTLLRMPKKEIIELLRTAEHNAKVSQEWVDQQAENIKGWKPVVHGRWMPFHSRTAGDMQYCSVCKIGFDAKTDYSPRCGAKMDGERKDNENE